MSSWMDKRMAINGILFQVIREVIAMAMGLSMEERKWERVTNILDETSLKRYLQWC